MLEQKGEPSEKCPICDAWFVCPTCHAKLKKVVGAEIERLKAINAELLAAVEAEVELMKQTQVDSIRALDIRRRLEAAIEKAKQ